MISHPDAQFRIGTMDDELNLDTVLRVDSEHANDIHWHYRTFAHQGVFQTGNLSVGPDVLAADGTALVGRDGQVVKDRCVWWGGLCDGVHMGGVARLFGLG